jgi:hypothetical protein
MAQGHSNKPYGGRCAHNVSLAEEEQITISAARYLAHMGKPHPRYGGGSRGPSRGGRGRGASANNGPPRRSNPFEGFREIQEAIGLDEELKATPGRLTGATPSMVKDERGKVMYFPMPTVCKRYAADLQLGQFATDCGDASCKYVHSADIRIQFQHLANNCINTAPHSMALCLQNHRCAADGEEPYPRDVAFQQLKQQQAAAEAAASMHHQWVAAQSPPWAGAQGYNPYAMPAPPGAPQIAYPGYTYGAMPTQSPSQVLPTVSGAMGSSGGARSPLMGPSSQAATPVRAAHAQQKGNNTPPMPDLIFHNHIS